MLKLNDAFDLAISMEVAEHLPERCAEPFVESLTRLADVVLFSAAVPFQGGIGHVNEQWGSYWVALFRNRGYTAVDIIRKRIWNDDQIPYWYRQNTLLFVKDGKLDELDFSSHPTDHIPAELYSLSFKRQAFTPGLKYAVDVLRRATKLRFSKMFRKSPVS